MSRRGKLNVFATVIVLVAGLGFVVVRPFLAGRGKTTQVPLVEIIRRYQASTSTPTPTSGVEPEDTRAASSTTASSAPASSTTASSATTASTTASSDASGEPTRDTVPVLPRPGVYVYATTGGDSIDALNGDHHDYPATTTITVIANGCGVLQRWDVAKERWQEWQRCAVAGGVLEPSWVNHDEFFGIGQTDEYSCTGDARPVEAPPGTTWVKTCVQGDRPFVHTGTVIGVEQVTVGGTVVQALHVQVTIDNGIESDRQTTDSWFQLGSDLLLVRSATNATTNSTFAGTVHYAEHYEIRLTSLVALG